MSFIAPKTPNIEAPAPPPPPPNPPILASSSVQQSGTAARQAAAAAAGTFGNIKTSAQGEQRQVATAKKQLLGGER